MADALIETVASNPYEWIVADTTTQMSDLDAQIQQVTSAINKLEQVSPTSPTLSQLRERLSSLQSKKKSITDTNNSAKSLMDAYNNSLQSVSTLKWIYDLKERQLNSEKTKAENEYNSMAEENRRVWQNYINALWNATSSENAIINANAWRQWASAQSTAEARARNYLNNAAAQNEAANNTLQNVNAIREWKINSNAWYTQLSQSNADNTLRQEVMNQFQASEAEKDRQLQERLTDKQLATQKSIAASSNNNNKWNDITLEDYIKMYNSLTDEQKKLFDEWIKVKPTDEEEKK